MLMGGGKLVQEGILLTQVRSCENKTQFRIKKSRSNSKTMPFVRCGHGRRSLNNSFSAKQRLTHSRGKFKLAVITKATFTSGIQRFSITTRERNLNIWRKRVYVVSYLGEGTFCLRSFATERGSVNTRNVATERLAKSDKLSENFSFRKIDRQLGFRSHNMLEQDLGLRSRAL